MLVGYGVKAAATTRRPRKPAPAQAAPLVSSPSVTPAMSVTPGSGGSRNGHRSRAKPPGGSWPGTSVSI